MQWNLMFKVKQPENSNLIDWFGDVEPSKNAFSVGQFFFSDAPKVLKTQM